MPAHPWRWLGVPTTPAEHEQGTLESDECQVCATPGAHSHGSAASAAPAPRLLRPGSTTQTLRMQLASGFMSHAVADEGLIVPVVERLRDLYGAQLFLCGDSIPTGSNWQHSIMEGLRGADVFVLLLSAAVKRSHFCSYEVGYAMGTGKDVKVRCSCR